MAEQMTEPRYRRIVRFNAAMSLVILASIPVMLIMSWATEKGRLGFLLSAVMISVWLGVSALVWSYGREVDAK